MTEFLTNILKNLGCSHCQEFEFQENTNKENFKNWKLYIKEYEMFSAMTLYNDILNKDISHIININECIFLLDNNNNIFIKLEYISLNDVDNTPILVPTEDYQNIDKLDKIFDKNKNAYLIGTFTIKKCK